MYEMPPDPFDPDSTDRLIRRERRWARIRRVLGSPEAIGIGVVVGLPVAVLVITSVAVPLFRSEPAETAAQPSATPVLIEHAPVDLSRPFAATPAANWAEGEAGIVVPPAVPVGRYSADQVAEALSAVRHLIATARLNRHVLHTHDPEPVLALLAPHQADEARELLRPGNEPETWWLTAKIAPGFRLLPAAPRVTGSMTPVLNPEGELTIRTNYLVAYAFHVDYPEILNGPLDIVSVVRREAEYVWADDAQYDAGSQGIYYGDVQGHAYSVNCALHDKGYLAPNYSNPPTGFTEPDQREPEEYFDPNTPLPTENGC